MKALISVSEVEILPLRQKNGLCAFASCIINESLYIGGLAIYSCLSSPEGFRIVYPTKILNNGSKLNLVYPITREVGLIIQKKIVEEYLKLIENLTKGDIQSEQKLSVA